MFQRLLIMSVVLPFAFTGIHAQSQPRSPILPDGVPMQERFTEADRTFIVQAGAAHRAELLLAALAESRAKDIRVRELAAHLLRDHEIELSLLEQLATERGVTLTDISEKQRQVAERIQALEGDEFDRAFVTQMINDHQDQLAFHSDMSLSPNLDVRLYAERRITSIRDHHRRAQVIDPLPASGRWSPDRRVR